MRCVRSLRSGALLVVALAATAAQGRPRPAADLPVSKWTPNQVATDTAGFMRGWVERELGAKLDRHAARRAARPGAHPFDRQRFVERFAARLLREAGHVDARLLPREMPLLPWTSDQQVQGVIDRGKAHTRTAKDLYIYLERQTALLRGSNDPTQRALGAGLRGYLEGYKSAWAGPWLEQRLQAFNATGCNKLRPVFRSEVTAEQRATVEQQVAEASRILGNAVHPRLLRRLPRIQLRVGTDYPVAGILRNADGSRTVTLRPDSTVKDILHEVGHFIGYHGGLRPLATAHAVRERRAYGTTPRPLSELISGTSYRAGQTGYEGGFFTPYVGRHYSDGFTEVLSMGLEHLQSKDRALELFQQDGEHFLLLLKAIQNRPR
jgi:hypothetical protein